MTNTTKYTGKVKADFCKAFEGVDPFRNPNLQEGTSMTLEVTIYRDEEMRGTGKRAIWRNVIWAFDSKVNCDQIVYVAEYRNSVDQRWHRDLILKYMER